MAGETILVTGATGMVGGAFAQKAAKTGYRVRALVRAGSSRGQLAEWGVETVEGDLAKPESIPPAVAGADYVVHSAAHVGDWGPVEKYRAINVYALEHLLTRHRARGPAQTVHPDQFPGRLSGPAPLRHRRDDARRTWQGLDGYTRTKAEAEVVLRRHMDAGRCRP